MSKLKWVLQAYCLKHGILAKNEQGLAFCPDCMTEAEQYPPLATLAADKEALERVGLEAANLCAWENGTARERGKTAEGRTVTALIYAIQAARARGLLKQGGE